MSLNDNCLKELTSEDIINKAMSMLNNSERYAYDEITYESIAKALYPFCGEMNKYEVPLLLATIDIAKICSGDCYDENTYMDAIDHLASAAGMEKFKEGA